jgi:hypothetical protein
VNLRHRLILPDKFLDDPAPGQQAGTGLTWKSMTKRISLGGRTRRRAGRLASQREASQVTLMDGEVWVHYAQVYVESLRADERVYPDLAACFAGQSNGLCGAAVPGVLFLNTGLHTGKVHFRAELHDEPPPSGDGWQEIVEVSFQPAGEVLLAEWGDGETWPLELARTPYRVRYCATGMDEGHDLDTRTDEDPAPDRYLLQFWPDPDGPVPDRIIRQTSEMAAYWHGFAREQPPPPSPDEQAEMAAAEERARAHPQQQKPRTKHRLRVAEDRPGRQ